MPLPTRKGSESGTATMLVECVKRFERDADGKAYEAIEIPELPRVD